MLDESVVQARLAELPSRARVAQALREQAAAKLEEVGADSPVGRSAWSEWPGRSLWYFWHGVEEACHRECERINRQWGQFLGQRNRVRRAAKEQAA